MAAITLPPAFVDRMRGMLGDEADAFFAAYDESPKAGLRVNTGKVSVPEFLEAMPWPMTPIPWSAAGFTLEGDDRPGRHPFHAAGLYYLQEPSAMAVAEALAVRPGDLVLDLAASPGGKSTHIASLLAGSGTLVANEIVGSRIKPLGENLERWGSSNTILLNDEPTRLAERLGPIFDRVLLDAPCSGEGMFRKSAIAIREWSPEHVEGSAVRQAKILVDAARLVRPGGYLLYSTCTFAPQENEIQIARFLDLHPGWELVQIPCSPGMTPARIDWSESVYPLDRAVRLWTHHAVGEGHFIALLRNGSGDSVQALPSSVGGSRPSSASLLAWQSFAEDSLDRATLPPDFLNSARLVEHKGTLYLSPGRFVPLDGLRVVRPGLPLGEAKPGRFEPSHALALALSPDQVANRLECSFEDARRYLAGEQLPAPGESRLGGDHPGRCFIGMGQTEWRCREEPLPERTPAESVTGAPVTIERRRGA